MLTLEIKKILRRKEFVFVSILMFLSVIMDYLVNCYNYYGSKMSLLHPAYDMTCLNNISRSPYCIVFGVALPLVASIAASDMYNTDAAMGINSYIITRVNKKTYVKNQGLAIFITVSGVTLSLLLMNLFLCMITFPVKGYSLYGFIMPYEMIEYNGSEYFSSIFMDNIHMAHPYINIIFFIIMRSAVAGMLALLSYGVAFIRFINKYVIFVSAFLIHTVLELAEYFLEKVIWSLDMQESWISKLCYSGILQINPNGDVFTYFKDIILLMILTIALILIGRRREEI